MLSSEEMVAIGWWAAATYLAVVFLAIVVAVVVGRLFFRSLLSRMVTGTAAEKAASLLLSMLLYREELSRFGMAIGECVKYVIVSIPCHFVQTAHNVVRTGGLASWSAYSESLLSGRGYLRHPDAQGPNLLTLVLVILLWIVMSHLLAGRGAVLKMVREYPKLPTVGAFVGILGLGLFLGLSSVAAISRDEEERESNPESSDALRGALKGKLLVASEAYPDHPDGFPLTSSDAILSQVSARLSLGNHDPRPELVSGRDIRIDSARRLKVSMLDAQRQDLDEALRLYEFGLRLPGRKESVEQYYSIVKWFGDREGQRKQRLDACWHDLAGIEKSFREWDRLESYDYGLPFDGSKWAIGFAESCNGSIPLTLACPVKADASWRLGLLRPLFGWAYRIDSLSVVLLVGMLGFGLLGSALTVIINPTRWSAGGAMLSGLIVRGSSAALVVFLAVQGGLAVFAGKEASPNPYALLLTCFLAAVFSEQVWRWARRFLVGRLPLEEADVPKSNDAGNA